MLFEWQLFKTLNAFQSRQAVSGQVEHLVLLPGTEAAVGRVQAPLRHRARRARGEGLREPGAEALGPEALRGADLTRKVRYRTLL